MANEREELPRTPSADHISTKVNFWDPHFDDVSDLTVQALRWNADSSADLLVSGTKNSGQHQIAIFSGAEIKSGSLIGRMVSHDYSDTGLSAAVLGDVNGDGLDDAIFVAHTELLDGDSLSAAEVISEAHLILGRDTSDAFSFSFSNSDATLSGYALADGVALGDINGDGYDDFAMTRSVEDTSLAAGSAALVLGSADISKRDFSNEIAQSADIVVSRMSSDAGPTDAIGGALSITTGDFDNDGHVDFALGQSVSIDQFGEIDRSGTVHFFRNVWQHEQLNLDDADLTFQGEFGMEFGTFASTPMVDINADGIHDMVVGASSTGFNSGRIFVMYGALSTRETEDEFGQRTLGWYEVKSQGDWAAGAYIDVTPNTRDESTINIRSDHDSLTGTPFGSILHLGGANDLVVQAPKGGRDNASTSILEFDISSVVVTRDNADEISNAQLLLPYSVEDYVEAPSELVNFQGALYFAYDDGIHGRELWRFNPETNRAELVSDIRTGASGSNPQQLTVIGNHLFFTADNGDLGREVWVTDTTGNIRIMHDTRTHGGSSNPTELTVIGDTLFYSADDGQHGRKLWYAEAPYTNSSVAMIDSTNPLEMTALGNTVFYTATDGGIGRELWKIAYPYNGSPQLVRDINTSDGSSPTEIDEFQRHTLFLRQSGHRRNSCVLYLVGLLRPGNTHRPRALENRRY